ncbi:UNVERIFIED_CONTAM: hypothetical protein NCL1_42362 [Trichonephila clavipes]
MTIQSAKALAATMPIFLRDSFKLIQMAFQNIMENIASIHTGQFATRPIYLQAIDSEVNDEIPLDAAKIYTDGSKGETNTTGNAPQLRLALGTSNQHSAIKEGNDVYFECNIKANPAVSEVTWYSDDEQLATNLSRGILVNNQSLILQKVGRENRGMYRCQATNSEGEGESDVVKLDIQCKYGVIKI